MVAAPTAVCWCLTVVVRSRRKLQKPGEARVLCTISSLVTGCGVTPRRGVSATQNTQTPLVLHVRVHVFLRGLTADVMTQPCCDQQLPGPQGSPSAVLGASTNVCSCLGRRLDVTAGRTFHACAGGCRPLHARCPSLGSRGAAGFFASSSVWRLAVLTPVRMA